MRRAEILDAWGAIGRAVASGVTCYVTLVVLLRLAGKRTLAHMDEFDLVVTVAMGSVLEQAPRTHTPGGKAA